MKATRTHAFAVPAAGLWLHEHEAQALRGLPAWYAGLWLQLLLCSDFKSGAGRTGYGELINACTPDQPARGPRLWAPSRDDVKEAMRRFESLRILAVDKLRSEQVQTINFLVAPRVRRGVPAGKLPPELSPGSTEGKRPKLSPGTLPGLSAEILSPLPLTVDKLSTGPDPRVRARLQAARDAMDATAAGGRKRAPKGA